MRISTLAPGDALVDRANGVREDQGAAVGQIVAIDGRNHEILPAEVAHGFGDADRLEPIDLAARVAGLHVAEAAAARAGIAQDHDRRGAGAPALGHVRTGRFFADRVERNAVDLGLHAFVVVAVRQRDAQPIRLPAGSTRVMLSRSVSS